RKHLGKIVGSRVAFRLGTGGGPEPDIAFIRKERMRLLKGGYVNGAPDLAMEIVSPDSITRDYYDKRHQYQAAHVREYWIVDPLERKVTLLRLDSRGTYREVRTVKGKLTSEVIKGFWVQTEWLWQDPLPDEIDTVFEIMKQA